MELKSSAELTMHFVKTVLIVPLWNWNVGILDERSSFVCFNRTFMELKWQKTHFNVILLWF